jgi:hypothetical protein
MAECQELQLLEVNLIHSNPSLGDLLALLNAPDWSTLPNAKNGACTG